MHKKRLPEDRIGGKWLSIVASLGMHTAIVLALLVVWPTWQKFKVPPVVQVRLVSLPHEIHKTVPTAKVKEQKTPLVKKKISIPSEKAIAIEKHRKAVAVKEEAKRREALEKQRREAWIKKQAMLKKKAYSKALQEKKARESAQRQAEAEKAERAKKALQQLAAEQLQQMQTEAAAEQQAALTKVQRLVSEYVAIIRQKVSSNWDYPLDSTSKMKADVRLTLAPTGEIVNLVLTKSSGNTVFDQSVLRAIRAAAPFEFLNQLNIRIFEANFRILNLKFTPQDLMK